MTAAVSIVNVHCAFRGEKLKCYMIINRTAVLLCPKKTCKFSSSSLPLAFPEAVMHTAYIFSEVVV